MNNEQTHNVEEPHAHASPVWELLAVFGALAGLTVLTVAVTRVDLGGGLNLWVAMLIAAVKATLVALFFMHLRYEKPFIRIIFISVLFFVFLMVSITLMDTVIYHPDLIPGYAPEMLK